VASTQQRITQRIALTEEALAKAERQRIFTADPIERPQIEKTIRGLQKKLFEDRKRLAALSSEPLPKRASKRRDSRSLVFVSYHQADREWLDWLRDCLEPLRDEVALDVWDDSRIAAGRRWREQIQAALQAAEVAVLLVSADYLASDYVIDGELPILLEGAHERRLPVLPVIVSPCRFERTPLGEFKAVNSPSNPLTSMSKREQDHIFAIVAQSIRKILASARPQVPVAQD
jgi:hypothetical protein